MKKTSNKNASQYVNTLTEFKANNLSGEIIGTNKLYVVKSYGYYPVFIYSYKTKNWYETEDRYSVSTAKQMTQVRPTGAQIIKHAHMEAIIKQPQNEVKIVGGASVSLSKYEETIKELTKENERTFSIPKVDRMFYTSKESSLVGIKKMSKSRVKFKPIKKRS
tara:strand:+ start:417 stop:905 length:489 start_codon:yes stop_codon:yes gene_type:complete